MFNYARCKASSMTERKRHASASCQIFENMHSVHHEPLIAHKLDGDRPKRQILFSPLVLNHCAMPQKIDGTPKIKSNRYAINLKYRPLF